MRNRNVHFNLIILLLKIYSIFTMVMGIIIMVFKNTSVLTFFDEMIDLVFFETLQGQLIDYKGFIYGLIGMMVFLLGFLTFLIVAHALNKKLLWAWTALFSSYGLLLVMELYFSITYAVWVNVLFSGIVFPIMLVLLLILRSECIKRT